MNFSPNNLSKRRLTGVRRVTNRVESFLALMILLGSQLLQPNAKALAEKPIPLEEAVSVMETLEGRIEIAEWHIQTSRGTLGDPNDVTTLVKRPEQSRGWVISEPRSGRYRVELDIVLRWIDGLDSYASQKFAQAFDGKITRQLVREKPGQTIPRANEGMPLGQIRDGIQAVKFGIMETGIGFFPPYFNNKRLSEILKKNRADNYSVKVVEDERGLWHINAMDYFLPKEKKNADDANSVQIDYDPTKGGLVLGARWGKHECWQQLEVQVYKANNQYWVPRQVRVLVPLNKFLVEANYSDVKINQPVKPETFQLNFPPGTRLTDHIQKKLYTVGSGPIDDQIAVRRYMEENDLYAHGTSFFTLPRIIGAVIVACLLVVFAFLYFRKKKTAKVKLAMLAVFLLLPGSGFAKEDEPALAEQSETAQKKIYVSQCGYNVTIFALEWFGIKDCQAKQIYDALAPGEAGVSLARIQMTLHACGLQAEVRDNVSVKDLAKYLRSKDKVLAIIPVHAAPKGVDYNHYVVGMRHPTKGLLLVDVLDAIVPLEQALADKNLHPDDGMVLFIQPVPSGRTPVSEEIAFSPSELDLGTFSLTSPEASKPLKKTFTIKNPRDSPLMACKVAWSCSCIHDLDWQGGLLTPGESRQISFNIHLAGWGAGKNSRFIAFDFADGTQRKFTISGEGLSPQKVQKLELDRNLLFVDATSQVSENETFHGEAVVTFDPKDSGDIRATSNVPWISCKINNLDRESARLQLSIVSEGQLLENKVAEGEVTLARREKEPGVKLRVVLFRHDFFSMEPGLVEINHANKEPAKVEMKPVQGRAERLTAAKLLSRPSSLQPTIETHQDGSATISIKLSESSKPGCYLIKCLVESEKKQKSVASLFVRVAD